MDQHVEDKVLASRSSSDLPEERAEPPEYPGLLRSVIAFQAKPIEEPEVDPEYDQMPGGLRVVESLRYITALLEYNAAANGWFRAWLLLWVRVVLLLLVPSVAMLVLLAVLQPMAAGLAAVAISFEQTTRSLLVGLVYLIIFGAIIAFLIAVASNLGKNRRRRS